jgi:hypothetical protein
VLVLDVCARTCAEVSAAVLCRGRAPGYRAGGVGLSGCPASAASEPPSVDGRPARGAVVRRVAHGTRRLPTFQRPCVPRPKTLAAGTGATGPRPATTPPPPLARPRAARAAPTPGGRGPGAYRKQYSCKNGPGSFLFLGGSQVRARSSKSFRRAPASPHAHVCGLLSRLSLSRSLPSRVDLPCCNAHLRGRPGSPSHTRSLRRSAPDFPAHVALLPGRRRLSSPPRL